MLFIQFQAHRTNQLHYLHCNRYQFHASVLLDKADTQSTYLITFHIISIAMADQSVKYH